VKDDRVYLGHILECLDAIVGYVSEGRSKFLADRKTQKATLRELQEPAESTQRLSSALKGRHPDLPWAAIAGFRNVLVTTTSASAYLACGTSPNATYLPCGLRSCSYSPKRIRVTRPARSRYAISPVKFIL